MKQANNVYDEEFKEYIPEDSAVWGELEYNESRIRTVYRADQRLWFHAGNVCDVVGYSNVTPQMNKLEASQASKLGDVWYVNMAGLKSLLRSARSVRHRQQLYALIMHIQTTLEPQGDAAALALKSGAGDDFDAAHDDIIDVEYALQVAEEAQSARRILPVQVEYTFAGVPVRTVSQPDGSVWWVVQDVAQALGYTNYRRQARLLRETEGAQVAIQTEGGVQEMWAANETGVFRLIFNSKTELAERFRVWVLGTVLPDLQRYRQLLVPTAQATSTALTVSAAPETSPNLVAAIRQEISTVYRYFESALEPAYNKARELEGALQKTQAELCAAVEAKEEANRAREKMDSVMDASLQGHREYMNDLVDQIRTLQEEKEVLKASRDRWEKRARRWGRKLCAALPASRHSDDDLALLTEDFLHD